MSPGWIAAGAFAVLVLVLAYPLVKLAQVFEELRRTVRDISDGALPLLAEVTDTVTQTNHQLGKVDTITDNVTTVSTNVTALTSLFAATVGGPLVKVAAFSYGVRQAFGARGESASRRRRGRR
ncbi:MAG: DUF948 domain-containing protein [Kineosporiaceae bacterium]